MTQDEIDKCFPSGGGVNEFGECVVPSVQWLYEFAKLVASAASSKEREEIAQFIEKTHLGSLPEETAVHYALLLKSYSTAIRQRG